MTTLLLAEHGDGLLKDVTAKALTAARALGAPVHILVAGPDADGPAQAAARLAGVETVLVIADEAVGHGLAEPLADLILALSGRYTAFVAPATSTGKAVMPRVAARLDVMQVSDAIAVHGPDTFDRPIYAGNAIQTVRATDDKKVITVRTASFKAAPEGGNATLERLALPSLDARAASHVGYDRAVSARPELNAAKVVVSGGRALGSADQFKAIVEPLADALGAAVGASRAAVDAGYAPNDYQVGQTGKVVAPDLYVAIGISGAIQHLAGMKDSKVIVAINKDEEAPIFQVADYALVGDLFTLVPALQDEIAKSKA